MRRITAAVLICAMLLSVLTGCGSIYDRSYASVTTHQEASPTEEDPSILRAESYASLVSCVQHFVSMGQTTGTVHLYQYDGDVESDLRSACDEVMTKDPLGAYMLSHIDYDYSRIVSYYECTFTLLYRRSVADMATIVTAYGTGTIRDLISSALSAFQPRLVVRTNDYYADRPELMSLAREAYYASPETAMGYPDITVAIYPDSGSVRILEFVFSYPASRLSLLEQAEQAEAAAARLVGQDAAADGNVAWQLYSRLLEQISFDPGGSDSVYAALCQGSANSEGIALACEMLFLRAGIPCQLVQGTLIGTPHTWNLITLDGTCWQLDLCRSDGEGAFLHNDDTMAASSYSWSTEDYPVCDGEEETSQASVSTDEPPPPDNPESQD